MATPSTPHSLIVEPTDGRTAILAALSSATTTIDVTIYELSDPQIVGSIDRRPEAERHGSGAVQLVLVRHAHSSE